MRDNAQELLAFGCCAHRGVAISASDDAQLPSSRILLIRKERQYQKEDEQGYEHTLLDHEVKQLDGETIEVIEYYTSAPPVHDGKAWYQYMNQFLRGLLPNNNSLPDAFAQRVNSNGFLNFP